MSGPGLQPQDRHPLQANIALFRFTATLGETKNPHILGFTLLELGM